MTRYARSNLNVDYRFRPLVAKDWPHGEFTPIHKRKRATFRTTPGETYGDLRYELNAIGVRSVVIQVALREEEIRQDGLPRANAKPAIPPVAISFEQPKVGPVTLACDRFHDWQHNLRAIVLTLEALRAVDRYGATKGNQQYRGFRKLAAPGVDPRTLPIPADETYDEPEIAAPTMDGPQAMAKLCELLGVGSLGILGIDEGVKIAKRKFHPDNRETGEGEKFRLVGEIEKALKR